MKFTEKLQQGLRAARLIAGICLHFVRHGNADMKFLGRYTTWVNGADPQVSYNVVTAQGIAQILKAGIGSLSLYIAPFTTDATPSGSLTAANFDSTLTEWTGYAESTRQAWTKPTDPVSGTYSNSASPAVFTANASATVIGAGLLSNSAKESTAGVLISASKFGASRSLVSGDKLTIQYDIIGVSA